MKKQNDLIECPNCGVKLKVVETPMGVPGGKTREEAFCPKCRTVVANTVTDGFLDAYLVSDDNQPL
ncbi:MAG: hypothetical protein ACLFRN_00315 [Halothece sp.]